MRILLINAPAPQHGGGQRLRPTDHVNYSVCADYAPACTGVAGPLCTGVTDGYRIDQASALAFIQSFLA